ncbi:hypothetical protein WA026_011312 [Henosepilachna vigintioctopunctata]|uniref:Uncharacterized protein n=1 Tax=Henosepilachna vigintioctopunctata TaxID=420089 RepID=A0AAW1TX77_9CUCU
MTTRTAVFELISGLVFALEKEEIPTALLVDLSKLSIACRHLLKKLEMSDVMGVTLKVLLRDPCPNDFVGKKQVFPHHGEKFVSINGDSHSTWSSHAVSLITMSIMLNSKELII